MMEPRLKKQLDALAKLHREIRIFQAIAICWVLMTVAGLTLFALHLFLYRTMLGVGVIAAAITFVWQNRRPLNIFEAIRDMEEGQPEMHHLLAAASEQEAASGSFTFLQWRVIEEALAHPKQKAWQRQLRRKFKQAELLLGATLLLFVGSIGLLGHGSRHIGGNSVLGGLLANEITVTPGDTNMERGTSLAVAARYGGTTPAEATLVVNSANGHETRIPMARRLADPVFGASVPEVSEAGTYHIEYAGKKSRDFKIDVFEYPALVRADADLRYPAYTGLTNRVIRDTLRVSAVEGSHLRYTLQLNKPVARARWAGREQSITLQTDSNALALLPDFVLTNNARFALELVDADGRSNKFPTDFILQALTNQRPEVKIIFPRGDPRVSRLEELQLQAETSDDFGILKYGVGFGVAGQEPQFVELGQSAPANAKRQFEYLISLEKLGVDVDQSVSYFAWAEDYGPDGQPRRTFSDMYFADVRPFEEIFRQDQSGGDQAQSGGQDGGDERVRLAQLQKQIVVATWNLEKNDASRASHP